MTAKLAHVGVSAKTHTLEMTVPQGMKTADLAKVSSKLIGDFVAKLPRGCPGCISGFSLIIREELAERVNVDLEKMTAVPL